MAGHSFDSNEWAANTPSGGPVPVPKDSLFKLAVDLTKAAIKASPTAKPAAMATAKAAIEQATAAMVPSPAMIPQAAPVGVPGVPLIKAKPVAAAEIPVAIPSWLAESILSKPSTGGGWQAIMGALQKALVPVNDVNVASYSHVLH